MFKLIMCFIAFFVFSVVCTSILNHLCKNFRKNLIILVDVGALFDIFPVLQRAEIYAQNKSDSNLFDYMQNHFCEIGVNPTGLSKAIKIQHRGYTLKFISTLNEDLRPIVAKLLNVWHLKGDLYLSIDNGVVIEQLNPNIIGIIGKNLDADKYAKNGLKVI
jgi:hypothetical protein